MPSSVLNGAASPTNCARNIAGPLIVFMVSGASRGTGSVFGAASSDYKG
jgi:hypothetical protein